MKAMLDLSDISASSESPKRRRDHHTTINELIEIK
jgi:hypothetical protein